MIDLLEPLLFVGTMLALFAIVIVAGALSFLWHMFSSRKD